MMIKIAGYGREYIRIAGERTWPTDINGTRRDDWTVININMSVKITQYMFADMRLSGDAVKSGDDGRKPESNNKLIKY